MKKLLVLENDQGLLEMLSLLLQDLGYEVSLLQTEEGILERIQTYRPDAILLDIIKPTTQGAQLCRTIKEAEETRHIPVIVLSTHLNVVKNIKNVCADDVLEKPFDIDDLANTIEKHLAA